MLENVPTIGSEHVLRQFVVGLLTVCYNRTLAVSRFCPKFRIHDMRNVLVILDVAHFQGSTCITLHAMIAFFTTNLVHEHRDMKSQ